MTTIRYLSNEILHSIFSDLCSTDLHAVSLVSHHFQSVAESLLYARVRLGGRVQQSYRLQLFLRTMLAESDHNTRAVLVKSLIVRLEHVIPQRYLFINSRALPPRDPAIKLLTATALERGLGDDSLTAQGAQLVVLLRLLPHLTSLSLVIPNRGDGTYEGHFEAALARPLTLPIGLQNLREFRIGGLCNIVMYDALLALMALPSIRRITTAAVGGEARTPIPHGTSTVTDLTITGGYLSNEALEAVLRVPKTLTRLSYTATGIFWYFPLDTFGRAFLPVQNTAQYLCIDLANVDPLHHDDEMPEWRNDTIGCLRGWGALQTLEIPLLALLGRLIGVELRLVDVLPLGLRRLVVYDDRFWPAEAMVQRLVGLLECGEMAALKELTVVVKYKAVTDEMEQTLRISCEQAELVFVMERCDLKD